MKTKIQFKGATNFLKYIEDLYLHMYINKHKYIVCGGFVRDILHNKKPKDVDIVTVIDAHELYNSIKNKLYGNVIRVEEFENYGDELENIIQILKVTTDKGVVYDIIEYDSYIFENSLDILSHFDYNINTAYLNIKLSKNFLKDTTYYLEAKYLLPFSPKNMRINTVKHIDKERADKFRKMFPLLEWEHDNIGDFF